MKPYVFGACVQGFSHIRSGTQCQDNRLDMELGSGVRVLSVADGHGSKSCPYSADGSKIAAGVFCKVMKEQYEGYANGPEPENGLKLLPTYLNQEGSVRIAQIIEQEWKEVVLAKHQHDEREPKREEASEAEIYRLYGTTLLGLLIAPEFVFAFQIGDGDIMYVDAQGAQPVVQGDKLLGVESHSLCSKDAWKRAVSTLRIRPWDEGMPYAYLLSTDGFANSFVDEAEFAKTCTQYFDMLNNYGVRAVEANLPGWLEETSRLGCGDDTTVELAWFGPEAPPAPEEAEPEAAGDTAPASEKAEAAPLPDEAQEECLTTPEIPEEQEETE